jgi:hypothetical protein
MMSDEIKPCPFCGKEFIIMDDGDDNYWVKHDNPDCPMDSEYHDDDWVFASREGLINAHNARAGGDDETCKDIR